MQFQQDTISTDNGEIKLTFIGHGTLLIELDNKVIHIDPWTKLADYSQLPKADIVLVTHEHQDHLDIEALKLIMKADTQIITTLICAEQLRSTFDNLIVLENGDMHKIANIQFDAIPAYNLEKPFHPKGRGNGYVIQFVDATIYIAGDTENIPEMALLEDISIAFLPMNLPYTMTPEMVAEAARIIQPKILYPYHYGDTDTKQLLQLLASEDIDIRIRQLQ